MLATVSYAREVVQTLPFRGRRSRNKVSVGEPAEGSVTHENKIQTTREEASLYSFFFTKQKRKTKQKTKTK